MSYWKSISYGGRKHLASASERADGHFLVRVVEDRRQSLAAGATPVRLITFRQQFRRIAKRERMAGMITCLDQPEAEVVRIAIWLLSRKHAKPAIPWIAPFCQSGNVHVRRETARALRRLEAWAELRVMAMNDPDERVCRLATSEPPHPFEQRFKRFAADVRITPPPETPRRAMSLFVRIPNGPGKLPKTPEFIRAILERIHRLVHG
jgi:hypothetical protein